MILKNILENVDFNCVNIEKYLDEEISSLSFNAGQNNDNGIYFCLNGSSADGHNFCNDAIKNGAKVLVCEKPVGTSVCEIVVSNSRVALALMAANFFDKPAKNLKIISITGTNGKTTTSYLVKHILENSGEKVGLIGTNGVFVGEVKIAQNLTTPDPIDLHYYLKLMLDNECKYVVMEASAHAIYLNKLFGIKNEVLAFTNLSQDHLDYFHNIENYGNVKANYFENKNANNFVVNVDDEWGRKIAKKGLNSLKTFSVCGDADYSVYPYKKDIFESNFLIKFPYCCKNCSTNLVGDFNLSNIACACAICDFLGISYEKIVDGVKSAKRVDGRFNVYHNKKKNNDIIIDFAHSPDGLQKILTTAKMLCKNRLICVFGCGGNRDRGKRPIMAKIAENLADYSIVTSDNPRFENPYDIINEITSGFSNFAKFEIEENRKNAIYRAVDISRKNDLIVIAGKGAENYQEINGIKHHFLDEEVVKNIINNNFIEY